MKKIKKCEFCGKYTLEKNCRTCKKPAKQAGYKFIVPYSPKPEKQQQED